MAKDTPVEKIDMQDNSPLGTFAEELKALLDKHNVAIEVQSQIVAVDLSKREAPSPVSLDAK